MIRIGRTDRVGWGLGKRREGVDIVDGIKGPKLFNLLKRRERGKKMGNGGRSKWWDFFYLFCSSRHFIECVIPIIIYLFILILCRHVSYISAKPHKQKGLREREKYPNAQATKNSQPPDVSHTHVRNSHTPTYPQQPASILLPSAALPSLLISKKGTNKPRSKSGATPSQPSHPPCPASPPAGW